MTDVAYLLDTNVVSDMVRNPQGRVAQQISEVGETLVAVSIVVACELRFGAVKSGARRIRRNLDVILAHMKILPLESPAQDHYADIRNKLERAGTPIGPNGLLIAAHARSLDAVLVTGNMREFSRVPGLRVENWLD